MAESARVESIEALKLFKRALWKFQESASVALNEAEAEISRVQMWLENEQRTFWASEVRKRQEAVMRAKEALRQKQIFKSPTGGRQSDIDEQKALQLALRRLAEAEQKVLAVKKYTQHLRREAMMYKGQVQRIASIVSADIPQAAHDLEAIIQRIEAYATGEGVAAPEMATSQADDQPSMRRAPREENQPAAQSEPAPAAEGDKSPSGDEGSDTQNAQQASSPSPQTDEQRNNDHRST